MMGLEAEFGKPGTPAGAINCLTDMDRTTRMDMRQTVLLPAAVTPRLVIK